MSKVSAGARRHLQAAEMGQMALFQPEIKWTAPDLNTINLTGVKRLGIDTETHDAELKTKGPGFRWGAKPVGVSLATDDGRSWYLPTDHLGGGNLDRGLVSKFMRKLASEYRGELVGANLGYDLDGLSTCWGVDFKHVKVFHDVLVAEPLLDEWRDSYSLEAVSQTHLGIGKDENLLREAAEALGFGASEDAIKRNIHSMPAGLVGPYAEADALRPLQILDKQLPLLEADDQMTVYEVERRLIPLLVRMRQRGVLINEDKVAKLRIRFVKEVARWTKELKRLAGPKAELLEVPALAAALQERGIEVPRTKPSRAYPDGQDSITKPFLEQYQNDPLVRVILNGRKFNTLVTTFIDGQILGHLHKGRVHPTFKQGKDDEGGSLSRFAGSHPNLQFMPARESDWQEDQEVAKEVRGVFEPEQGEEWQRDDFSQIEYRFTTHFAVGRGAEEARQAYLNDPKTDFHKLTADMLGVDREDKKKRKRVKNTNFAKSYGAQAPKLALTFGCSVEEAEEFVREYEEKLPFTKDTFDACAYWAQRNGYVTTILGRKQRFPFWGPVRYQRKIPAAVFRDRAEAVHYWITSEEAQRGFRKYRGYTVRGIERVNTYMGMNRKMQGSSADLTKKAMVDADEAGILNVIGPFLVTVHDELGSSIARTKIADEAGRELTRIMENAIKLKVPVLVESDRGADWGACS
jgi:DNA polymerase I-like protein with 3'-5' exonuclease and polymerase domains